MWRRVTTRTTQGGRREARSCGPAFRAVWVLACVVLAAGGCARGRNEREEISVIEKFLEHARVEQIFHSSWCLLFILRAHPPSTHDAHN